MYTAQIENKSGEVFLLTGKENQYQVLSIRGLNPPPAQINTATVSQIDGALFNSSRLATRNIVLTVKINGDVEANRLNLYNYFRTKEWCRFYYTNDTLNVYIDGYVETVECDIFQQGVTAQISIICPYPYFSSAQQIITDISATQALFEFPFSINEGEPIAFSEYDADRITNVYNASESETGCLIKVTFSGSVAKVVLNDISTSDTFTFTGTFAAADVVYINTYRGQKSITKVSAGTETNIFSDMAAGSVFFQLMAGSNLFTYSADDGASNDLVAVEFIRRNEYRGV